MVKIRLISVLLIVTLIFISLTVAFSTSKINYSSDSKDTHGYIVIGSSEKGDVIKSGPYGNCESPVRVAYVVGVHPLENRSHTAIINAINEHEHSFRYCYYIYQVNVKQDADNYSKGRYNGQVLARDFVVPDVSAEHFNLAVDVHSNVGNWAKKTFLFSPVNNTSSESLGLNLTNELTWLTYYTPPSSTSPEFVTIPIINAGVPAIIYESYSNDSNETVYDHALEFVDAVDKLKI